MVFLQDSAYFRSKFPDHSLFAHSLFSIPEYGVFAANVLANLDEGETDQNVLIRQALPHLGQQQVDLNAMLTSLVNARFERIDNSVDQLGNSLHDFLSGKVSQRRKKKPIFFF